MYEWYSCWLFCLWGNLILLVANTSTRPISSQSFKTIDKKLVHTQYTCWNWKGHLVKSGKKWEAVWELWEHHSDFNNFGFCLISPFSLSLCSPSITNIYDGQVHLRPQAGMDSSGHGWSSDSASPPGRFPGGRSSWSWTRWRGRAGRSWAHPRSRRAIPRSCPTHPPAWGDNKISQMWESRRDPTKAILCLSPLSALSSEWFSRLGDRHHGFFWAPSTLPASLVVFENPNYKYWKRWLFWLWLIEHCSHAFVLVSKNRRKGVWEE